MNQKELREIRRRIQPERSNIRHLYGCYVNTNKEIISYIDESLGLLSKEEGEKYLSLLKKGLSGALGKNLLDISFATKQVMDSEEHRLLSALRKSELQDAELRDGFIASEEVGDHSVEYRAGSLETDAAAFYAAARMYLTGTGLLYSGVPVMARWGF